MKRNIFLWGGVVCVLAALLSSCAKEDDWHSKPLETDQTFFATVSIMGTDAMTRAESYNDGEYEDGTKYDPEADPKFEEGDAAENAIKSIYLIFYDIEGNRVSTTQVRKGGTDAEVSGKAGGTSSSGDVIYRGIVQIDVKHGSYPPAYVMAFINPITSQNFEINPDFATLESMSKTTRDMIIGEADNSFAMSKSVYYGTDPVTGEENAKIEATPLVTADKVDASKNRYQQLFTSYDDAEAALNGTAAENKGGVVNIYVERYAAKVKFSITDNKDGFKVGIDQKATGNGGQVEYEHTLTFIPEYWAVNAYESKTYASKSFFKEGSEGVDGKFDVLTFEELNAALGGAKSNDMPWHWNSEELHRSYWAQSPAYYAKQYPRVADDILDKPTALMVSPYYALGYYSYNEMVENANGKLNAKARKLEGAEDGPDPLQVIYARENTVAGSALQSAYKNPLESPKAAIPSIALVGHYKLDGADVENTFYIDGNATNGYTLFKNYNEAIKYLMKLTIKFKYDNYTLFDTYADDGEGAFTNSWDEVKSYFTIKHPNMEARGADEEGGGLVIDSRFVTVQLKTFAEHGVTYGTEAENIGLEALLDGEWVPVTDENVNKVNQQMLYTAGTLQGFQGGKAYYTIPIKHLGFYRSSNVKNAGKNANDKDFDWNEVKSGDFGLVRNHIYSIIVDDIKGLGNGIPDPNDPIVPPTDPEEYFIGARIIVLNWAVVPDQHVTL